MASATFGRNPKASKELQTALQDDSRRQAIDAAKKRAVGQHVDYDTFKNMVAVAHLKPLQDPVALQSVSNAPAWKFAADGLPVKAVDTFRLSVKEFDVQTNPVPSSSDAFIRTWKRQCTTADSRFAFLKKCGAVKLQMLFKLNLPGDLLSDILIVLNTVTASTAPEASQAEHLSQQHADSQLHIAETNGRKPQHGNSVAQLVFEILQSLTGTQRFALTMRFLSPAACGEAIALFQKLHQAIKQNAHAATFTAEDLDKLQTAFGMTVTPCVTPA